MAEVFLTALGIAMLVLGIVGAFLPVLPGPPLAFLGVLVFSFIARFDISGGELCVFGLGAFLVTVFDYWFPVYGAKLMGGSRRGMWGAATGLVIGIFFPPLGLALGSFIGALVGEFSAGCPPGVAIKAALGSIIGLLVGIAAKFIYAVAAVAFVITKLF